VSETGTAPAGSGAEAAESRETVYVFNVGSKDVTLIDVANRQVGEIRPLGVSVRWLSNEQTYWDGARIWTYDFPNNQVQAVAIDPRQVAVTKTIAGLGKGPGHSLVVLPDRKKAAINVAGDNLIAFLDLEHGGVESTLQTGAFP
jgi:YVTN family beta-propeller protein